MQLLFSNRVLIEAEVCSDPATGLMFRRALPEDAGVLFVFREPSNHTLFMRNTLLALDMIFIGSDGRIVGILENVPPMNDTPRSVNQLSRYVLEVNGGWCRRHGVKPGMHVSPVSN